MKKKLLEIENLEKKAGAISISKTVNSKYYSLRKEILDYTKFMDEHNPKMSFRIYAILNDITVWPNCQCGCGTPLKNIKLPCVSGHSNRLESVKQKKIKAYQERYGVDNPSQSLIVKNKKKETCVKNWGAEHYMKSESGFEDYKNRLNERYGVTNIFQLPDVKKAINKSWIKNKDKIVAKIKSTGKKTHFKKVINRIKPYFEPLFDIDDYHGVDRQYKYKFKCLKCNDECFSVLDDGLLPRCYTCYPLIKNRCSSYAEVEIFNYINNMGIACYASDRTLLDGYEVDILIPDYKIAIEYDGLYWHSELNNKDKNYHLDKTKKCIEKGYTLIHIFEDEWIYKQDIVKSRLNSILHKTSNKIHGRKCTIKIITPKIKNMFLDNYHLQGADRSNIHLGAYHGDTLVAVMCFSEMRQCLGDVKQEGHWELSRFAVIDNTTVYGIASKLLKFFKSNYDWKLIKTHADLRWSVGNLYFALGFKHIHNSDPNYWYFKTNKRWHRFGFRKTVLSKKLENFYPKLSEWENMQLNGYNRIWDCGTMVFKLENI